MEGGDGGWGKERKRRRAAEWAALAGPGKGQQAALITHIEPAKCVAPRCSASAPALQQPPDRSVTP